jgi:hypothetical protein
MLATRIRPVSDLRKLALYEKIAASERQIAAGRGKNARKALAAIREKYHV